MRYDHSYVEQATVPPLRLWTALDLRFYQPTHGYSIYELVLSTGACCHCGAHAAQGGLWWGLKEGGGGKKNTNTVPIDLQNPWLPPVKHIQRDTVNLLHPYILRSHWITFNILHKLSWQEALHDSGMPVWSHPAEQCCVCHCVCSHYYKTQSRDWTQCKRFYKSVFHSFGAPTF